MKRVLLGCVAAALIAAPALAALEVGKPAPNFEAQASLAGKAFKFSLREKLKSGPVVVYFYPSAYTGGCNVQGTHFRRERREVQCRRRFDHRCITR